MRSILGNFPTEKVRLLKHNGKVVENIKALIDKKIYLSMMPLFRSKKRILLKEPYQLVARNNSLSLIEDFTKECMAYLTTIRFQLKK